LNRYARPAFKPLATQLLRSKEYRGSRDFGDCFVIGLQLDHRNKRMPPEGVITFKRTKEYTLTTGVCSRG
jgi:hypothetical protein